MRAKATTHVLLGRKSLGRPAGVFAAVGTIWGGAVDNAANLARCKSLRRQLPVCRVASPHCWGPAL
jgi:hypothetical protein